MNALPLIPRAAGLAPLIEALERDGAAIVPDALPADTLARLDAELDPWFDASSPGEGPFFGRRTRRFSGLFAKAASTIDLALDPLALAMAEHVLGIGIACDCIQLNLTQAIGIAPGEPAQLPHRDDSFFPAAHDREWMINVLWALDPFEEANGATLIAAGSHKWPRDHRADRQTLVPACAPAGAAIIWLGSVIHGGGANRSDMMRRGVVMSYSAGWLAPAEKLLLSIPPEVARTLPERLQRLIGYQIHRPNLGWVEGRDPLEWLDGAVGPLASARDNLTPAQEARIAEIASHAPIDAR
jgi:hypothetical protein